MIEAKVKYKRKTYTALVPEKWEEVRLKHVIRLEGLPEDNTMIDVLCCFIDLDSEVVENSRTDLWEPLFKVLDFVYNPPKWNTLKRPKQLSLNGKVLNIPSSLEMETFGQKVLALQAINQHKEKLSGLPELLTIYLQPKYDGKYLRLRQDSIRDLVNETLAIDSIPIGLFFLQQITETEKLWNDRFEEIPKDYEADNIFSHAGGPEKLGPFNDLIIIDNLAKLYNYTHDEVFNLEWNFVNNLLYMHSLQDHIKRKMDKIHKQTYASNIAQK